MDIDQRTEDLIGVKLDEEKWHVLSCSDIVSGGAIDCLGHIFENKAEIDFIPLPRLNIAFEKMTNLLAVIVEVILELNDIRMFNQAHDLQLTVLNKISPEQESTLL